MLKKILYGILVLAIIIIISLMWKESKTEAPTTQIDNQKVPEQVTEVVKVQVDTPASISSDLDKINVDAGIDSDLNTVDTNIKAL